jgi:hypothetical protein
MTARAARGAGRWVQGAVAAAVSSVHHTRPGVGASAAEHAVWWQRHSDALYLIADHETDAARAAAVRADAATAATLAAGMAAAAVGESGVVPGPADRWSVLDDAALAVTRADEVEASIPASEAGVTDAADVTDAMDVMDAELMEVGW